MSEIIKMLQNEIHALKVKGGKLIEENTVLKGFKAMVMKEPIKYDDRGPADLKKQIGELQCEIAGLKTKIQDAELETSLIKAVGLNSPEMKERDSKIAEMIMLGDDHQKLNGKLQMSLTNLEQENIELHADNIKLARQIEDQLDRARKAGL
jgi:regulator of replication initiation timing